MQAERKTLPSITQSLSFHWHRWRRETTNYSLFKSRGADAQIVSQHQSGTHWLKFMLANAMANQHDLPAPQYNHANDYIGGPKDDVVYPQLPYLVSSHSIPPVIMPVLCGLRLVRLPKYILLVRDIRASLVSNYRKWTQRYDMDFSSFLEGDPAGRRFNSDIWWSIRFLNAWGRQLALSPDRMLVMHYEDLRVNTLEELSRINIYADLSLSDEALRAGISAASKTNMLSKADPKRPPGEIQTQEKPVPTWFSEHDKKFFSAVCAKFLKYDFGYDYQAW